MERQEIEIEIGPKGEVTYKIVGVKGSACEQISELLDQLGKVQSSERTSEYYDLEPDVFITVGE